MQNIKTHIVMKNSGSPWASAVEDVNLKTADLDWQVTKNPLVTLLEGRYPLPIESHVSINRSDTNEPIGLVGANYGPIQNTQIWEALHRSLDSFKFDIVGGGYTHNGGRVFLQVNLKDDDKFSVNGEAFSNFITLYSSHDGSSAFEVFDTCVRIICQNTLQASRRSGGKRFKLSVKHTSKVQFRFENMMVQLEKIFASRAKTFRDLQYLNEIFMSQDDLRKWAVGFFTAGNSVTPQGLTTATEVTDLAIGGIGNRGQSAYDMLNGVTELLTHGRPETKRTSGDLFRSSEFGNSANKKAEALDYLSSDRTRGIFMARGEDLIRQGTTLLKRPTAASLVA